MAAAHPGFILPKDILPRGPFKTCDPINFVFVHNRKDDSQLVIDNLASPNRSFVRDGVPHKAWDSRLEQD